MNHSPKNELVLWGRNDFGILGLGYECDEVIMDPRTVSVPNTTWTQVSCAAGHTAAVSSNGDVWTWGIGQCDVLGHSNYNITNVPKKVEIPGGEAVIMVTCQNMDTAVVTATGNVFTWYAISFNHFFHLPFEFSLANTLLKGLWVS